MARSRCRRVSLRKSKVGAIRANLIVISGTGGNGEREAHRDRPSRSAVYVTWDVNYRAKSEVGTIRGWDRKVSLEEIDFTGNEKE